MHKTIPELFFQQAVSHPHKICLSYKQHDAYSSLSFGEVAEKVKQVASGLWHIGIRKGDKLAILCENRPEWAIADLAALAIGVVVVPVHTTLSPKIVQHILNHSEAKVLIVSTGDLLHKVQLVQNELPFLRHIISLQACETPILAWQDVVAKGARDRFELPSLDPEEVCTIMYTSGTTGFPKGVELSHRNLLSNVEAIRKAVPVRPNDVFLSFLPLSHVLERVGGYYVPLLSGATIVYAEGTKQLSVNLKEVNPTILISVPRIFEKFHDAIWDKVNASSKAKKKLFVWALKQRRGTLLFLFADRLVFKKIRAGLGGRLRLTISGGASLNKKLARFFMKIGVVILEGYGLTETSPVIALNRERDLRFGTVGKTLQDVEVSISPDKEILVRGPNVTRGYFKDPEATREAFDSDKWFHTGDLGFLDEHGFLTVIGRRKEMIVTAGGKNVSLETIENELNGDRFIAQSMVLGNNRKFLSALIVPDWQEVKLFLKRQNIQITTPENLITTPELLVVFQARIDTINEHLSQFERIIKFHLLVDEFSQEKDELTPTLKLRRHVIEKRYHKEIEILYTDTASLWSLLYRRFFPNP